MSNAASTGMKPASERTMQQDMEQLRRDIAMLRQDVSGLANDFIGVARGGVSTAVSSARQRGMDVAESIEEQVQEHPLATVGVAFGVGLVVGALMRRG